MPAGKAPLVLNWTSFNTFSEGICLCRVVCEVLRQDGVFRRGSLNTEYRLSSKLDANLGRLKVQVDNLLILLRQ